VVDDGVAGYMDNDFGEGDEIAESEEDEADRKKGKHHNLCQSVF